MDAGRRLSTTHPTLRESIEPDGSPCSLGTSENTRGDDDEAHRISLLEMAIEKVTAERDQLSKLFKSFYVYVQKQHSGNISELWRHLSPVSSPRPTRRRKNYDTFW
ncbi:hypothetical protein CRM22_001333 [Opisthorchis felineus]|uniref:Uncharacterized protein n=1 Tax=Opisthorchis felineus TaxID=147828 RepID=A0A4S2MFD0_OPIFE|nr:hypothetical protein CRM22_001333 [Opisthorchis felineus]